MIGVEISQRDVDRVLKRLDKWQAAPLRKRADKAIRGGLSLLVNPIRSTAPVRPAYDRKSYPPGTLRRSVKVKSLRRRPGETVAYKVGPTAAHRFPVISGHVQRAVKGGPIFGRVAGIPFVDRAVAPLEGEVRSFITRQIRELG